MDTHIIAERIREARNKAGFTQKEVADRLGMTYQAISNYERGINRIEVSILSALCNLYGTTVPEILQGENDEQEKKTVQLKQYHPTQPASLAPDEYQLVEDYRSLNNQGQEFIRQTMYAAKQAYKKMPDVSDMEQQA